MYSKDQPKRVYENEREIAYWGVRLYANSTHVTANRFDATIAAKKEKGEAILVMSYPWLKKREVKAAEKTCKYVALRWELQQRYPVHFIKVKSLG